MVNAPGDCRLGDFIRDPGGGNQHGDIDIFHGSQRMQQQRPRGGEDAPQRHGVPYRVPFLHHGGEISKRNGQCNGKALRQPEAADSRQEGADLGSGHQIASQHKAGKQLPDVDGEHIYDAADARRQTGNKEKLRQQQKQEQSGTAKHRLLLPCKKQKKQGNKGEDTFHSETPVQKYGDTGYGKNEQFCSRIHPHLHNARFLKMLFQQASSDQPSDCGKQDGKEGQQRDRPPICADGVDYVGKCLKIALVSHKGVKLRRHKSHGDISAHGGQSHYAIGDQIFGKALKPARCTDEIGQKTTDDKKYGHHPEHSGYEKQKSADHAKNSERPSLRNFGDIEHKNRAGEESHHRWHKRKRYRRHLYHTADHEGDNGIK